MSKISTNITHLARNIEGHDHEHAQILIPLSGLVFMKSDHGDFVLDNRTVLVIPPEVTHYFNGSDDNEILILNFPKSALKKVDIMKLKDLQMYHLSDKMILVKELLVKETDSATSPFAQDYLFYYLYDLLLSKPGDVSIEYISKNYDSAISISELAAMEHYSENYYREWFRKKTGLSPREYIQRFRVEKAKELLLSTQYAISEIGYQVGFAHNSSFTRAFKEVEGSHPSNYRNKIGV